MKYKPEEFKNINTFDFQKEILEIALVLQAILTTSSQDFKINDNYSFKKKKILK